MAVPLGVAGEIQSTAFVSAACRAEETAQPNPRLTDPFASLFFEGQGLSGSGKALVAAGREEVVQRTVHIDRLLLDEVARYPGCTVLSLGAGLCTRPYRLDLSACASVVEVDAPEMIARKEAVLGPHRPSCAVRRVAADVRELPALAMTQPVIAVTEGLLVYLRPAELDALATALRHSVAWVTDVVSAESARAMAAVAGQARADLSLYGLSSMDAFEAAGWAVGDYRPLLVTRPTAGRPGMAAPPGVASSRRVVDGVVLLR